MAASTLNRTETLILLGHGSHYNKDSSLPVYRHAELIRSKNVFNEVLTGFWKEESNLSRVIHHSSSDDVYIVPFFMSDGYFTEQILPRELNLETKVSRISGQRFFYCDPIGTHDSMSDIVHSMVLSTLSGANARSPLETTVIVVGHGTSANENSSKSILKAVRNLNLKRIYHEVLPAFMEEEPFDRDILKQVRSRYVVVIPFFASDGLHSREDIPLHMELKSNPQDSLKNPVLKTIEGRPLEVWYTAAIAAAESMSDIILDRVKIARDSNPITTEARSQVSDFKHKLTRYLSNRTNLVVGNVAIKVEPESYSICHIDDITQMTAFLETMDYSEEALDALARIDNHDQYRPLRSAPNLRRGWVFKKLTSDQLWIAINILQPGAVQQFFLQGEGRLIVNHFIQVAARQSGIYQKIVKLNPMQVHELAHTCCGSNSCTQSPLWNYDASKALGLLKEQEDLKIPCPEPCNWFLEQARRLEVG